MVACWDWVPTLQDGYAYCSPEEPLTNEDECLFTWKNLPDEYWDTEVLSSEEDLPGLDRIVWVGQRWIDDARVNVFHNPKLRCYYAQTAQPGGRP